MKKLLAFVMTLALLVTAAASFAEEQETLEINWSDYEANANDIGGVMASVSNKGFVMFVPGVLKDMEISDAETENGVFLKLIDEAGTIGVNGTVVTMAYDLFVEQGVATSGGTEAQNLLVNGVRAVSFTMKDENGVEAFCVAFPADEAKSVLLLGFYPGTEENKTMFQTMVASIQAE